MLNYTTLLNSKEKAEVVRLLLLRKGAPGPVAVVFDKRFGWDFKVSKGGKVVFSVEMDEKRFEVVVKHTVRALFEIRRSNATYIRGREVNDDS